MPKFAANLTMLFNEVPFLERFEQAKKYGFKYIEYLFPYAYQKEALKQCLEQNELSQVLFNLPPGDWDKGERGIACLPDRVDEFRTGVEQAIDYAQTLGVKQLNCLSGLQNPQFSHEEHWNTLISNLRFAEKALRDKDLRLLIEPINSKIDMPGFFLDTFDKAKHIHEELNAPNLQIQFDFYHMQIMHGDVLRLFEDNLDIIGHVQFANNPGRHEPTFGELNYPFIFERLDQLGYSGYVSAEYKPKSDTASSLTWF